MGVLQQANIILAVGALCIAVPLLVLKGDSDFSTTASELGLVLHLLGIFQGLQVGIFIMHTMGPDLFGFKRRVSIPMVAVSAIGSLAWLFSAGHGVLPWTV